MQELLEDILDSTLFVLAMQRSVVASQLFRLLLKYGSEQTVQVLTLEALRSRSFMEHIVPHIELSIEQLHCGLDDPDRECDGNCRDCSSADTSPPGDDDTIH